MATSSAANGLAWSRFTAAAPDLAAAGRRLLQGVGYLATVSRDGRPRVAPVSPIFANGDLYLSVGTHTPKAGDLGRDGRYVLHALIGAHDEEFQIAGRAALVSGAGQRTLVHRAIQFAFEPSDPVFALDVNRCLWCIWENVAQPNMRAIRKGWLMQGGTGKRWETVRTFANATHNP